MREKRRYILLYVSGISEVERFANIIYETVNKMNKTLAIQANINVIKDLYRKENNGILGVISVSNKYKYDVIFILSMIGRFFPATNLVTLRSSGSLKKIKGEMITYGASDK